MDKPQSELADPYEVAQLILGDVMGLPDDVVALIAAMSIADRTDDPV